MRRLSHGERGDTLIEVLVAVVALSVIVTTSYTIMTRGFAQGQTALERTTTQGMLSGQIAILRDIFARHESALTSGTAEPQEWIRLTSMGPLPILKPTSITSANLAATGFNGRTPCSISAGVNPFYFDPNDVDISLRTTPTVFNLADVVRSASSPTYGDGIWLEGYKVDDGVGAVYYIFFAKACWDASVSGERQSMVTAVRFYEPR